MWKGSDGLMIHEWKANSENCTAAWLAFNVNVPVMLTNDPLDES
jgi:hypothetical protein